MAIVVNGFKAILVCMTMVSTSLLADDNSSNALVTFSADIVEYNKYKKSPARRSLIKVSPSGMRVETQSPDRSQLIVNINNIDNGFSWITLPAKRIYTTFPDEPNAADEDQDSDLMSLEACPGEKIETDAVRIWQGLKVTAWRCTQGTENASIQYYSKQLGRVVYHEVKDGSVRALENIQPIAYVESDYLPPADFTQVSMRRFFTGKDQLPAYKE